MRTSPRARLLLAAAGATIAAMALPAPAVAACAYQDLEPTAYNGAQIRQATMCLLNEQRRARRAVSLRPDWRLARAALDHSRDMVVRDYFAHYAPGLGSVGPRVYRARYMTPRDRWYVGENLAWGQSYLGTPRRIVTAWMNSPGHRANVLNPRFREIGVGVVPAAPDLPTATPGLPGATYTTEFGVIYR